MGYNWDMANKRVRLNASDQLSLKLAIESLKENNKWLIADGLKNILEKTGVEKRKK